VCAGGVGAWSESLLYDLGIELNIPSLFVDEVEFRFQDQRWLFLSPRQFRMVQRVDFDQALVDCALKRGAVFNENEPFSKIAYTPKGLTVSTRQGLYAVKALVGADGSLSTVRRMAMRPRSACLASTLQLTLPADPQRDTEFVQKKARIDLSPIAHGIQGYLWRFPCLKKRKSFINIGTGHARFGSVRPKMTLKELILREMETRATDIRCERWSSHPIRWFSKDAPIACPHVILAGDAAGIEPAFGGGIHMALSYGEVAAQALVEAFKTKDFTFRHYRQALMSHYLGRYIEDYTRLARQIYAGKESPLDLIRQFYTDRLIRRRLQALL
jgi:flavin-dependent dehydrogenase